MSSVKILDAGDRIMLSAATSAEVEAVLRDYVKRGAKVVSPLGQIGTTWVAACTPPTLAHAADKTTTLHLSELAKATAPKAAKPLVEPASDGVCTVEKIGLKRLISGPSLEAVKGKVHEFVRIGFGLVSEIEEVDGTWLAVCDTGGGAGEQLNVDRDDVT